MEDPPRPFAGKGANIVAFHPGNLSSHFAKDDHPRRGAIQKSPLKHVILESSK